MINHINFPGLGIGFTVNRVAFTVMGAPIYWYGVLIAIGMALGVGFVLYKSRAFGLDADKVSDVLFWGLLAGIAGARAYYVAFSPVSYQSVWDAINIRDGGLAIYGGLLAGVLAGALLCKWKKVPVLPLLDLAGMGFFIGQGIGRWGNFVNQEAFGTNTTLPWGMHSESTAAYLSSVQNTLAGQGIQVNPALPVHPTFLYESLWCFLGFLLLWRFIPKRRYDGQMFLFYIFWYGTGRAFIEGLRTDSLMVGGFRTSQLLAAASALATLALLVYFHLIGKNKPLTARDNPMLQTGVKVSETETKSTATKLLTEEPTAQGEAEKPLFIEQKESILKADAQDADAEAPAPTEQNLSERTPAEMEGNQHGR